LKFDSLENLIDEANKNLDLNIKYNSYHRSADQRQIAAEHSKKHRWYNNGVQNVRVTNEEEFCKHNPEYVSGRIKV
jgi:hypothetical protein